MVKHSFIIPRNSTLICAKLFFWAKLPIIYSVILLSKYNIINEIMKSLFEYLLYSLIFSLVSCSPKMDCPLEDVLKLAVKNRHELERVFEHFSKNPTDSLKLKAAEFLILNMPGKYTESYEAPWEDIATVNLRWTSSSDKSRVLNTYKIGDPIRRYDIDHITADYLISNIDLAFEVWDDKPWGKHISFETFCEEILPYRIGNEPLENWREKVLASFADLNYSLKEDSAVTAVEACTRVNDILPRFRMDKDFSNMSFTQLMATTRGTCDSQASLAIFVMRGLGIPVTFDFTPQWRSLPTGHSWNSVCDSTGQHISFLGTETNPHGLHQGNTYQKAKAYRKTFRNQPIAEIEKQHIPPLFHDNIVDISSEHNNMTNVSIPIKYRQDIQTGFVFLSMFYDFEWRITGHTELDSDSIRFKHVGKDILYLPVYYMNEKQVPAGDPFYIDSDGVIYHLNSDSSDSLISFNSITSEYDLLFYDRMINGAFESSKSADFSDSEAIHRISTLPMLHNKIKLKQPHTCQFIRYKSPNDGWCNVSEITFYDASGKVIEGKHIGTSGSWDNLGNTGENAFDGDIFTFYDASEANNSWTGLDFGEEKEISTIQYSPRIIGIGIYEGHEYELFCWEKNGWQSIEKKIATEQTVKFSAPRDALFYITNNTLKRRGNVFFVKESHIFFYN